MAIYGTVGDDVITGTDLADVIIADGPTYPSDGGDDVVHGGIGSDFIDGHTGDDLLDGGSGSDELLGWRGDDTLIGGIGDDVLQGGPGRDMLYGGYGNDRLVIDQFLDDGGPDLPDTSADLLDGGPGYDRAQLELTREAPVILSFADPTIDQYLDGTILRSIEKLTLWSGSGDDIITGGAYNDHIWGNGGDDQIDGGAGDDEIDGGSGENLLWGGEGEDWVSASGAGSIYGGAGDDTLIHSGSLNQSDHPILLDGGSGNDQMFVTGGRISQVATILGAGGDDTIMYYNLGSGQQALFDGGDGIDVVQLLGFGHFAPITLVLNDPSQDSVAGPLTLRGIERIQFAGGVGNDTVTGGDLNDVLTGDYGGVFGLPPGGNDTLSGGSGDDDLDGKHGDDRLSGGAGDDAIRGDFGRDTIMGGAGDDTIIGGNEADTLYGSAGADTFIYESRNDSRKGDGNRDVIKDFTVGEDKIDISALKGDYAVVDEFSGLPGQIMLKPLASGYTAINIDTDGDLRIDMQIYAFTSGAAMSGGDFVL